MSSVTHLLELIRNGNLEAKVKLLDVVYGELKQIANFQFSHDRDGHTLQPTALVNEAYLRLFSGRESHWENRAHFFSAAAEAMRRILVEYARRRGAKKRGGDYHRIGAQELQWIAVQPDKNLIQLSEALDHFKAVHPLKHQLVQLRYFTGLSIADAAELMEISIATANRYWAFSKAWLFDWIRQNVD